MPPQPEFQPEKLEPVARALSISRYGNVIERDLPNLVAEALETLAGALESGLVVRAEELADLRERTWATRDPTVASGEPLVGSSRLKDVIHRQLAGEDPETTARDFGLPVEDVRVVREWVAGSAEELAEARGEVERLQEREAHFTRALRDLLAERDSLAARLEATERVRDRLRKGAEAIWREVHLARSEAADELLDALEGPREDDRG